MWVNKWAALWDGCRRNENHREEPGFIWLMPGREGDAEDLGHLYDHGDTYTRAYNERVWDIGYVWILYMSGWVSE